MGSPTLRRAMILTRVLLVATTASAMVSSSAAASAALSGGPAGAPRPVRPALEALKGELRTIRHLERASAVLGWDQLVMMPPSGASAAARGASLAALAGVIHDKATSPALASALAAAEHEAEEALAATIVAGAAAAKAALIPSSSSSSSSPSSSSSSSAGGAAASADGPNGSNGPHAELLRDTALLREARRSLDRETRVPTELAERAARLGSEAYGTWAAARAAKDYGAFQSTLATCFATAAELATARAGSTEGDGLYDWCLGDFERGMTSARLQELFGATEAALKPLIARVVAAAAAHEAVAHEEGRGAALSPSAESKVASFPLAAQEALNREVVEALGFDSERGRIDVSVHPFTTSFGPNDVRITSRFSQDEWYQGLAGSVHECGHALYEGGLRDSALPIDEALSMGVHESQSLFWERHVGLSRPFWTWCGPKVRKHLFPSASAPASSPASASAAASALAAASAAASEDAAASASAGASAAASEDAVCGDDALYRAVNRVQPRNLIRVEADELTYPMHVILRFRLEARLLEGTLDVSDLPGAWAAGLKALLGDDMEVPDDGVGCLQDVHWSGLAIGYFPTYLLGAMMAAQLDHHLRHDQAFLQEHCPDGQGIDGLLCRGEFGPIKAWLGEKVHDHGKVPGTMDGLLTASFGEPLNPAYFLRYLEDKYTALYGLEDE